MSTSEPNALVNVWLRRPHLQQLAGLALEYFDGCQSETVSFIIAFVASLDEGDQQVMSNMAGDFPTLHDLVKRYKTAGRRFVSADVMKFADPLVSIGKDGETGSPIGINPLGGMQ